MCKIKYHIAWSTIRLISVAFCLLQLHIRINSQTNINYLLNSGFELHRKFVTHDECANYNGKMYENWDIFGMMIPTYNHIELKNNLCSWGGNQVKIKPIEGKACIEFYYDEFCGLNENSSCTNYISAKLIKPLEIGKSYKISYWLYFPSNKVIDIKLFENVGFTLTQNKLISDWYQMLQFPFFSGDTVIYNKWYQVSKVIKPLCPLEYFTFGLFKNKNFPTIFRSIHAEYYYSLDNIEITECSKLDEQRDTKIQFCKYLEENERLLKFGQEEKINLFYKSNSSIIDKSSGVNLNKFVFDSLDRQRVYYIKGFANRLGDFKYNKNLAEQRVQHIYEMLMTKYNLQKYQIITNVMDSAEWQKIKSVEVDDSLFRKVEIRKTTITKIVGVYLFAIKMLHQCNNIEFIKSFRIWLANVPCEDAILFCFDPRIQVHQGQKFYAFAINEIKSKYLEKYKNINAFLLDSLGLADQKYRTLDIIIHNKLGFIKYYDEGILNSLNIDLQAVSKIDSFIYVATLNYLKTNSIPQIKLFGNRITSNFIRILNHSADTINIPKYLNTIYNNCMIGENNWVDYCTLHDKYMVYTHKKQKFGTVMKYSGGLADYDNLDSVNRRRDYYGLPLISN